jgi:hypothetical protein
MGHARRIDRLVLRLASFAVFMTSQFTMRRRLMMGQTLGALFLLILSAGAAQAGSVTLAWDPNTEPDFAGYIVLYGTASGVYTNQVDVGNQTTWTLTGLTDGLHYYFTVKAYNQTGFQSAPSTEVDTIVGVITPPSITAQPQSQSFAWGQAVSLSVTATGTAPLSYQWYVGTSGVTSAPIPGAIASTYSTPALTSTVSYWVSVSNGSGSPVASSTARLTLVFTDDVLTAGSSLIRGVHITELRQRIDALRQRVGLSPFSWTDPVLSGVFMKTVHISELRVALGAAYSAAGRTPPAYTDPAPAAGQTVIKAIQISELRAAVVALE